MKRYIRCNVLTDDEIIERFEEEGLELTSNPYDAIYLLRNGKLISGVYEGVRSEDHRAAECLLDDLDRYDSQFWYELIKRTGMVMLVPETHQAILYDNELTPQQSAVLDKINYEIMEG